MNVLQNLRKQIKKRIQASTKRFFNTNKSCYGKEIDHLDDLKLFPVSYMNQMKSSGDKNILDYPLEKVEIDKKLNCSEITEETNSNSSASIQVMCQHTFNFSDDEPKYKINSDEDWNKGDKSQPTLCPEGRHMNVRPDEPCICINVNTLNKLMCQPILREWHRFYSEPTSLTNFELSKPVTCIQGGQGIVFCVYDRKNKRHFALKMKQRQNKCRSSWLIERRETDILKQIQHNFIVNLFHVHETCDAIFMIMEFLNGGCLWSHIAKKGTLPESYAQYYSACILEALHYLHQLGIVYRDLKAENIVIDSMGRPKLIDFGMAKQIDSDKLPLSKFEDSWGPATQYYYAAYLAPEVYSRPSCCNSGIDSWGIGYIVSEILLGYGVFVPMPWDNDEAETNGQINTEWEGLKLRDDNFCTKYSFLSNECKDLLESTLVCNQANRLPFEFTKLHSFYRVINWTSLPFVRPPDLSVFKSRIKGSSNYRAQLQPDKQLSSIFELYEMPLPDPLLTPTNMGVYSTYHDFVSVPYHFDYSSVDARSPKETPVNPKAPSIKLPNRVNEVDPKHYLRHNKRNATQWKIALNNQNTVRKSYALDTISNLRPNWKF